jgi:hypothetical protein
MASVLVGGKLVKAIAVCQDTDQISENTFWFLVASSPAPTATDKDFATQFEAGIAGYYRSILNNNATFRGTLATICELTGKSTFVSASSNALAGPGTGGAESLPRQSCGITSWYTQLPRQANRGRSYWPFPATDHDTGDGIPDSAYVTAIAGMSLAILNFTTFTTSGRSATFSMQLFHRKLTNVTAIVSLTARQAWATQRRRGTYGRQNLPPV